jgi:phosphoribosylformylglycinamidine synthase
MNIELGFLHDGLPVKYLMTKEEKVAYQKPPARINIDMNQMIIDMLKRPNITSYEFISNQYDYEVQASSVVKPLEGRGRVNGDIAVLRPIFGSKKGIVLSAALNPTYSEIDSYKMAASSIDGAIRAIVAAGATMDSIALLDNFCWCSSNDPVRLGQLKKAVKACYDYSTTYETPFISGKDSMFNDFKGFDEDGNPITISVPPTLLVSSIGVMEDVTKVVSTDFKFNRDLVYMLGDTYDECAGSEYFAHLSEKEKKEYAGSKVPGVNAKKNKKLYKAFGRCVEQELIASAISVGRGGVAIAVLKSAMAGKLGARLFLKAISALTSADDFTLFSESQGRLLVSIAPRHRKEFEKNMRGISCALIGKVTGTPRITIDGRKSKNIVDCDITRAIHAYKSTFKDY